MLQYLQSVLRAAMIGALLFLALPVRAETTLRVGHFPNITHIQGLVAHALSRQGKGFLEPKLGSDVKIEWFVYNAGPSAMEAIFAKSIDFTYVGPIPRSTPTPKRVARACGSLPVPPKAVRRW